MDVAQLSTQPLGGRRVAWLACGLSLFFILCRFSLDVLNGAPGVDSAFAVVVVANAVVGGLVASRRSANPVGWLFLGSAVCLSLNQLGGEYATYLQSGAPPFARAAVWITIWPERLGAALLFVFLPLYFPNGRLVSPRWRPVARLALLFVATGPIVVFMPGEVVYGREIINPLGVEALRPIREPFDAGGLALFLVFILVAVASLVARFRRSGIEERQQIKWFMYAVSTVLVWFVTNSPIDAAFPGLFLMMDALIISGVPVAAGIAILKYRLFDIDLVINRTLVYGALTAIVIALYVLVVGYLGALFQMDGNLLFSLIATGIVAVLFAPLRDRLQRGVNRLMYGERDDPYAVISHLGERLEATLEPEAVLPTITRTVRESLKLPYAAIELREGERSFVAAEEGSRAEGTVRLPLSHHGEEIGSLLLVPRPGESGFSPADRRLLDDLARQAGTAAHAVRLTRDLQRSRERLVTTREEERRRLRRDLHDGLGPTLGSLPMKLDVASDMISSDPEAAKSLLHSLKEQARSATSDVRRLVHELRPPALDELGLAEAVREVAARQNQNGLRITVETPETMPPLPAAVEVAAYRIAGEAMTNVVRHARASRCEVRLILDGQRDSLRLEISDDGRGIREDKGFGVGLHSMRERAEELGGTFAVASSSEGGVKVCALLPLGKPEA